jgi:hypothetical protein
MQKFYHGWMAVIAGGSDVGFRDKTRSGGMPPGRMERATGAAAPAPGAKLQEFHTALENRPPDRKSRFGRLLQVFLPPPYGVQGEGTIH